MVNNQISLNAVNRFEFCEEETAKKDNEGGPVSTCGVMAPLLDPDTRENLAA